MKEVDCHLQRNAEVGNQSDGAGAGWGPNAILFAGFDDAVVIAVETTGRAPKGERLGSVAMVRANFGKLRDVEDKLHGETLQVAFKPGCPFEEVADQLREFIGTRAVIAHDVKFARKVLDAEFTKVGVRTLDRNQCYCIMRRFWDFSGRYGRASTLDDVLSWLGLFARRRGWRLTNALEDVHLAFVAASMFYKIDNGISMPGGEPGHGPSGTDRRSWPFNTAETVALAAVVFALLAWWF